MEPVSPGQLNKRIAVKSITYNRSAIGEPEQVSQLLVDCWAKKVDVSGNEEIEGKVLVVNVVNFYIRYRENIAENATQMYVVYKSKEYNIVAVSENGVKAYLELKCVLRE